jgi:hypothetical protein
LHLVTSPFVTKMTSHQGYGFSGRPSAPIGIAAADRCHSGS